MENNINWIKVQIEDAFDKDTGRGIVRIGPSLVNKLNAKRDDIIEIYHPEMDRITAAKLEPGKEGDKVKKSIRIGPEIRRNLNAKLNDLVKIRKIKSIPAKHVIFSGLRKEINIKNPEILTEKLEGHIMSKGDIVSFNSPSGRVDLVVEQCAPKSNAVKVHKTTEIIIENKKQIQINKNNWFELFKQKEAEVQMLLKKNKELEKEKKILKAKINGE